jgi:hypothetical protein
MPRRTLRSISSLLRRISSSRAVGAGPSVLALAVPPDVPSLPSVPGMRLGVVTALGREPGEGVASPGFAGPAVPELPGLGVPREVGLPVALGLPADPALPAPLGLLVELELPPEPPDPLDPPDCATAWPMRRLAIVNVANVNLRNGPSSRIALHQRRTTRRVSAQRLHMVKLMGWPASRTWRGPASSPLSKSATQALLPSSHAENRPMPDPMVTPSARDRWNTS